ncbi:MAG: PLP-dependent aminotransferase family protein, partial [Deltaproteobacteria bacterium]|nr:PLP-dependent aminotransferase family protein [Deltaproteobacteria bacterium]
MTIWQPNLTGYSGPKYQAIVRALAEDIRNGVLSPGTRLPPQRELADQLGITLGTVTRALKEAAHLGLVSGEVGRGTYVKKGEEGFFALLHTQTAEKKRINLSTGGPSLRLDPEELRRGLIRLAEHPPMEGLETYQPESGSLEHRSAGARYIQHSRLEATPDRIAITSGGQNAIAVTLSAVMKPHDTLLVEELTYPGVKGIASLFHYKLAPLSMDGEGILPQALEAAVRNGGPKVLYLQSTLQNPTSAVMGPERREAVAHIARKHDLVVVEDNVYGYLDADAPPPVGSLIPERTYYLSTLGKSLLPGLRIGYVLTPPGERSRIAASVQALTVMTSPLNAELAAQWINDGTVERQRDIQRREAALRQQMAREVLEGVSYQSHPYGSILWVSLTNGWEENA